MIRGYIFLERTRTVGADFWGLEKAIDAVALDPNREELGVQATLTLWGQYDMVAIAERPDVTGIQNSLSELCRLQLGLGATHPSIADSTTMISVEPDAVSLKDADPHAILAIDTHFGHEQEVRDSLRRYRDAKGRQSLVISSDIVLGDHDIITLIRWGNGLGSYIEFLGDQVNKLPGIRKTRTIMVPSRLPDGRQ